MSRDLRRAPVLRCLFVWSAVTAGIALLLLLLGSNRPIPPAGFEAALTRTASLTLIGCAVWLWVVTTVTACEAASGLRIRAIPACPQALRRLLMTACGVALAASVAPAHADSSQPGLPPTPTSSAQVNAAPINPASINAGPINARVVAASTATASQTARTVQVQAGDSLWKVAETALPTDSSVSEIDRQWRAIWQANRDTVGDDPNLIAPGQRLTMPETGR